MSTRLPLLIFTNATCTWSKKEMHYERLHRVKRKKGEEEGGGIRDEMFSFMFLSTYLSIDLSIYLSIPDRGEVNRRWKKQMKERKEERK
jgi:hypothetical protein